MPAKSGGKWEVGGGPGTRPKYTYMDGITSTKVLRYFTGLVRAQSRDPVERLLISWHGG